MRNLFFEQSGVIVIKRQTTIFIIERVLILFINKCRVNLKIQEISESSTLSTNPTLFSICLELIRLQIIPKLREKQTKVAICK